MGSSDGTQGEGPGAHAAHERRAGPPLILGYHGIGVYSRADDPIGLYVGPDALRDHVRRLQRRGYRFVQMSEFAELTKSGGWPPRGIAALTFDDGTEDQARALPDVLGDLGVPGTVYVCPGLAGRAYPWVSDRIEARFMTAAEIVTLGKHPLIEIGSHTNEHHELHEADEETALEEMISCKQTLEALLGDDIVSFCYPRCHYSPGAWAAAPRAGYTSAVSCGGWGSWDLFELKREVLRGVDGPVVTTLRLRGWYAGLGGGGLARIVRLAARAMDRLAARRAT